MNRNVTNTVVELDGSLVLCKGGRAEQITDVKDIGGDIRLLSDLQGAVSRTMTVEASAKYAEVMVRKTLQETGEYDEPVAVLTHWKGRKGAHATDIFFTAMPARRFYQYQQQIHAHERSILLFPVFSVLHQVLNRMREPEPAAVVFQHGRFADLVVGTKKRVFYANRCVAFDQSPEQMTSLWGAVRSDIRSAEAENRITVKRILLITWIDTRLGPDGLEEGPLSVHRLEEEPLTFNGDTYSVSLLNAIRMQRPLRSASMPVVKASYCSARVLPYLTVSLLGATLLLGGGHFWHATKARALEKDIRSMKSKISEMRRTSLAASVPYEEALGFTRELFQDLRGPSLGGILGDMTDAFPKGVTVDLLKIRYDEGSVRVEAFADIQAPFEAAYRGYQGLCRFLRQKGYDVGGSEFQTSIQRSRFMVRLQKKTP